MRLRSFHGDSLHEAMRLVRDELGPNAIIVATRDDENGGVRVTAAVDDTETLTPEQVKEPLPDLDINLQIDVVEMVAEQLMRHSVPAPLAERILSIVTHFSDHDVLIALGAAMDKCFKFAPLIDADARPICLIGPPGAGKTLAVAKLATHRVLNKKTVGVITTDLTRAGAVGQLSAYTKLLKVNLMEVDDAPALKDAVDAHKKDEIIFVDSAGRNPYDAADMADLKKLLDSGKAEPVLVMPAGMDAKEAVDMAQAFKEMGASKLIITKADMTKRMGSVLAMANELNLQLCDLSNSPKVTEPLQVLNPVTFARMLLPPDVVAAVIKAKARA
jgi:flagellar biosynthesis protein FlhF